MEMKSSFILILLCSMVFVLFGNSSPYRPFPIIWVHGLGGSSGDWGAPTRNREDWIPAESIKIGSTFDKFIHYYFYPYYAESLEIWYPNHTRLEVINFDWNNGSIDADSTWDVFPPYCDQPGQGWELRQRIKEVLEEYYGQNWQSDTSAKVIIVAHSMGCATSREVIREEPSLANHIKKFVLLDGANNGSYAADASYIVVPALAIAAIYAPTVWGTWILAAGSAATFFVPLITMNAYHDATWDLRSFITLGFIPQLNEATQTPPPGVEWACLVGRDPWPAGVVGTTMGAIGAAIIWAGDWVLGGVVIASGITLEWWNHNSDLVIQTSSQDIVRQACPNYQRELIEDDCLKHANALKKWEYIRDFLEPPLAVYLDSVYTEEGVIPITGETDTVGARITKIVGKVDDYFLAQNNLKVVVNYEHTFDINWPNNLGYDRNKFRTPNISSAVHFQWNHFDFISKNVSGDSTIESYDVYVALGPGVQPLNPPLKTCYGRIDTTITIKVNFYGDTPLDTVAIFVAPPDSDFKLIAQETSPSLPETLEMDYELRYEGEYHIKARAVSNIGQEGCAVYPFWVDTTAPTLLVYEPKAEDSLVYSPLVIDSMPISIHFNDNLQETFKQPKDKAIHIQIAKVLPETVILIWDTVVVDCYYKVEKRFFWGFNNHQGDGKYRVIAQISDIAGNEASDTSYFYIDTTPPEITVLQSLSPNPFTYDDPCMTFIFTTSEWTEISLKYVNLNDTTKVYERSLLFPYWDIDTNGVRDTLYIVESENWYGGYLPDGHYRAQAWAKDKAGNRIEIDDFVIEDSLIVDKTRPIIKDCYCQPFVVKRDSAYTTLYFEQNESEDVVENRKGLTAKVYLDTIFICSTTKIDYDSTFDVSALANGPHTFRIESQDWVGNKSFYSAQFVIGSLGSEITYPAEGDSNLSGIIVIKGWASDPNLENSEPFSRYELWYKRKPEIPKGEGDLKGQDKAIEAKKFQNPNHKSQTNSKSEIPNNERETDEILKRVQNDKRETDEIASPRVSSELAMTESEGAEGWQSVGIWVPEGYREPGGPQNRSIKEVVINSTIGYWDVRSLVPGDYILRLTTYEKGTESLSVVYRNVKVKGGLGGEISVDTVILSIKRGEKAQEGEENGKTGRRGDTETWRQKEDRTSAVSPEGQDVVPVPIVFHPLENETLLIDYEISKACGNVNLEIFNPRNKKVFGDYVDNVVPYRGIPESLNKEGYYFYCAQRSVDDDAEGRGMKNEIATPAYSGLAMTKGWGEGIDTFWCKWLDLDTTDWTGWSGTIEGIDGSYIEVIDSIGSIYFNIFGNKLEFSGMGNQLLSGFSFRTDNKEMRLTFKKNGVLVSKEEIFFGKSKVKSYDNPIIIKEKKPFRWDGITEWGSYAGSGLYRIKISAEGLNNQGYAQKEKTVEVITPFEIDSLWVIPTEFYPSYDTILNLVTLYYRLIQDGYVRIEVLKDNQPIIQLCDGTYAKGIWTHQITWDGRYGSNIAEPDTYHFKITAINLDSTTTIEGISPPFYGLEPVLVDSLVFSIPHRYFRGIVGDSVYDGLGEFSFRAISTGEYYPPQSYKYLLEAKGYKKRPFDWQTIVSGHGVWTQKCIGKYIFAADTSIEQTSYFTPNYPYSQDGRYKIVVHKSTVGGAWGGIIRCSDNDTLAWLATGTLSGTDSVKGWLSLSHQTYKIFVHADAPQWNNAWIACTVWYNINNKDKWKTQTTSGYDTILGNQGAPEQIAFINVMPFQDSFPEADSVTHHYTLKFWIDNTYGSDTSSSISGHTMQVSKNGVSLKLPVATSDKGKLTAWADSTNSYCRWDTSCIRTGNLYSDGENYQIDSTRISDIIEIPADVDPTTVQYTANKIAGSPYANVSIQIVNTVPYVIANVANWNSIWNAGLDTKMKDSYLRGIPPSVFTHQFDVDGLRDSSATYCKYYYPGSWGKDTTIEAKWKVNGWIYEALAVFNEITNDTTTSFRSISGDPNEISYYNFYWDNPYLGGQSSIDIVNGNAYIQVLNYPGYDKRWNIVRIDSLGDTTLVADNISDVGDAYQPIPVSGYFNFYKQIADSNIVSISPGQDTIDRFSLIFPSLPDSLDTLSLEGGFSYYSEVNGTTDIDSGSLGEERVISTEGITFRFISDSIHISAQENWKSDLFWNRGDSSNPWLKVDNWQTYVTYPDGDTNRDLSLGTSWTGGFGQNVNDWFKPKLNKISGIEQPKKWIEIDGICPTYYKMLYWDSEKIGYITKDMMAPRNNFGPLAFWDVSTVYGNVTLILQHFSDSLDTNPDSIKIAKVKIGQPAGPNFVSQTVHSPYWRAQLNFTQNSFSQDTIAGIMPVSIRNCGLGGNVPYFGQPINPTVWLRPKGAKFPQISQRPTLTYRFNAFELDTFDIDTTHLTFYAVSDEGDLIEFPFSHTYDGNIFLITLAPNWFPGDTTHSIFAVLDTALTVKGKPKIEKAIVEAGKKVKLIGKANPNQHLFAIATDPADDIYDVAELLGAGQFKALGGNLGQKGDTIDSISFYTDSLGNYSVELQILTGMNKIFVFDGRVKDYMKTRSGTLSWPTGVKTNCAVAYTFVELDTIPHLEIVGERNPVIDHIFDTERIRVLVDKPANVYYSRYDLQGQLDESQVFAVEPYETLSIWWDGKDRYGNYAGNGQWWYRVYAKDNFGRVSNEEQGYFLVARGVPIEIVSPLNNSKNAGIVNLKAEITNGGDYPVSWKFYNQFWGDIGTQPHPGIDFPWDTRQVYDGRSVLITATSVDPLGNLGSDTISIMIDNTPPEIILTKGIPSYGKYIRWQTQLTLTSIDTLAGVLSSRYKIDTGNWNDFFNSVEFNLSGYAQGAHTLYTEAKDSLQNLRERTFEIFIDEMAPLIGFEVGQPSNYYNGIWYLSSQTPINLWGKDSLYQNDGAGIGLVKYSIDNGPWQTEDDSVATIYLTGDGWHKVLYKTVDRVANASPVKIDSFYVDNYPPVTEIHIGEPKYGDEPTYITSNTQIWFTATDSGVGVWYTQYAIGDTLHWITYEEPFTIIGIPDGLYKIFYRSVDYAGNIEQAKEKLIYLDNTPPEIIIEIGEPKYGEEPVYLRKFTEIKITVSDAGCGVDSARYKIEPGDWNYFVEFVQFDLQAYEEGLHNFFTFAIDHLGNNQEILKILAIDETPPNTDLTIGEPQFPLPGDSVLITSQTPLDLLAYDIWSNGVASGVDHLAYRFTYWGQLKAIEGNLGQLKAIEEIDKKEKDGIASPAKKISGLTMTGGGYEWVIIPDSVASLRCEGPDGWYLFEYFAQDHVENREEINTKNLVLDNTPPEGMIISPLDSTLINRTIKIIGTATDPHFALYQVYYGIGWSPNQWILIKESNTPVIEGVLAEWNTDLLQDGRYTVRLVVKDLVNNQTEDRILLIVGEPQYSFEITGFNKCEGVAVDEAGYIYVADRNSNPIQEHNRIAKFDPYGNLVLNIFDVRKPNGVDVDDYGNIYASEWAGDCITKFSPTGESLMTILGFNKPNGVAVDNLQQIYIADQNNNRIVRTDKDGNFNLIITGLGHPEGVDAGETETRRLGDKENGRQGEKGDQGTKRGYKIYTTDTDSGRVKVFDESGNLILEFGEGLNQPADVEVDSRGYIWVVDRNNNRILCYDFFGNRLLDFGTIGSGPGEFNKPEGVAVSEIPGGVIKEVFVADRNNDRVCKFIIPYLIEPEASIMKVSLASPGLEITEAVAYPSPFDPNKGLCRIRVVLTAEADVKLTIYTIAGKVVYRDEIFSGSGIVEFVWDGRNDIGEMVNNGVYGFLIQARNGNEVKERAGKFIVMKNR